MLFSALKKFFKKNNIAGGFTLIELLVVISIIAILTAVATVSYTNIQMKSRDGKRKADLAAIQQGLGAFYADNGAYPLEFGDYITDHLDIMTCDTTGTLTPAIAAADKIVWGGSFKSSTTGVLGSGCNGTTTYASQLPDDPNYPGKDNANDLDHGFVYEVYAVKYDNFTNAPNGWCKIESGGTGTGQSATSDKCQHYTLWTTLENSKDPDILKTQNDQMCRASIRYEVIGSNSGTSIDFNSSNGGGWAPWAVDNPNNTTGTRNYCVHN